MIDPELKRFLEEPVMLIVASVGDERRMAIGRASGLIVTNSNNVEILISRWQWPDTIKNLATRNAVSLTAASAVDYTSYQLKGFSTLHRTAEANFELANRYISETLGRLEEVGVPVSSDYGWFSNRDLWSIILEVSEVFVQTPGPLAGTRRVAV